MFSLSLLLLSLNANSLLYSFHQLFYPFSPYIICISGKTVMSRLLCLSRSLICTQCKYSVQKSEPFVSLLTSRAKLRDQLIKRLISTSRRPAITPYNSRHPLFWLFGLGTGFVLALGLKYRDSASGRCECDVQQTLRVSKYSAAIDTSRDLLQRIKVTSQVSGPHLLYCVTLLLLCPLFIFNIVC